MNQKEQFVQDAYQAAVEYFCMKNNKAVKIKTEPDSLHCTHKARGLIIDFGKQKNIIFQYCNDDMKHKSTERTLANLYDAVNWLCYITDE